MMTPVTLGPCAAWLHGAQRATNHGIIVCGALGHEDVNTRASLAQMAAALATQGLLTLRLDLTGSGHAAPLPAGRDVWGQWKSDLQAAVDFMRGPLGCAHLTLIGLRIGGALALEKAASLNIDNLVLMAPVLNGLAYHRELTTLAKANDKATNKTSTEALGLQVEGLQLEGLQVEGLQVEGFEITTDMLRAVDGIDLRRPTCRPAAKMFVQHAMRDATTADFEARVEALGTQLWSARCVGIDALLADPLNRADFAPSVEAVVSWVHQQAGVNAAPPAISVPTAPAHPIRGAGWDETRHLLGQTHTLAGVLTRPSAHTTDRVLIVLNTGAHPATGVGGSAVRMARHLAAQGFHKQGLATLRLDLPGLGDSLPTAPNLEAHAAGITPLFADAQRRDLSHVLDWLSAQGLCDVSLMGAGAGAYQAFHGALDDARINKVFLINPPCFERSASNLLRVACDRRTQAASHLRLVHQAQFPDSPPTLPSLSDVTLPLAGKFAANSVAALTSLAALAGNPTGTSYVESWFRELSARGTQVDLIYTAGDPSLSALDRAMGRHGRLATCLPLVERHVLDSTDATLCSPSASAALHRILAARFGISSTLEVDMGSAAKAAIHALRMA